MAEDGNVVIMKPAVTGVVGRGVAQADLALGGGSFDLGDKGMSRSATEMDGALGLWYDVEGRSCGVLSCRKSARGAGLRLMDLRLGAL